jgi:hypothetical protein
VTENPNLTTTRRATKIFLPQISADDRRSKIKGIDFISAHLRASAAKIVFLRASAPPWWIRACLA